jgi:hypothetical protein
LLTYLPQRETLPAKRKKKKKEPPKMGRQPLTRFKLEPAADNVGGEGDDDV